MGWKYSAHGFPVISTIPRHGMGRLPSWINMEIWVGKHPFLPGLTQKPNVGSLILVSSQIAWYCEPLSIFNGWTALIIKLLFSFRMNDVSQSWLTKMSTEILLGRPKVFPRLRLEYLFATATSWYSVLPWDTFSTKRAELKDKGEDTDLRRAKFTQILGANHFVSLWDQLIFRDNHLIWRGRCILTLPRIL